MWWERIDRRVILVGSWKRHWRPCSPMLQRVRNVPLNVHKNTLWRQRVPLWTGESNSWSWGHTPPPIPSPPLPSSALLSLLHPLPLPTSLPLSPSSPLFLSLITAPFYSFLLFLLSPANNGLLSAVSSPAGFGTKLRSSTHFWPFSVPTARLLTWHLVFLLLVLFWMRWPSPINRTDGDHGRIAPAWIRHCPMLSLLKSSLSSCQLQCQILYVL